MLGIGSKTDALCILRLMPVVLMLVVLILCIGTRTDAKESKPDAGSEVSFTES